MRFVLALGLSFFCLEASAADPVSLLLKALAPIPLSLTAPQSPSYELYQNAVSLKPQPTTSLRGEKPQIVQTFIFDPAKFDDLTGRYQVYQSFRDLNHSLLLTNVFDEMAAANVMTRVMDEYFRRIYQGYAYNSALDSRRAGADPISVLDFGRNMIVSYQSLRLSEALEARLSYDVIGRSSRLKIVTPVAELDTIYYSADARSPASIPENVVYIDDAMDEFTRYERTSASAAHTFREIGLRLKARYGADTRTVDYGFSQTIVGPLAVQAVREENTAGDLPNSMAFQITLAKRF